MNIITHALIGWCAGQRFSRNMHETALLATASVIPDIDAAGAVVDLIKGGEAVFFSEYHHKFGHCLLFCVVMTVLVYWWRKNARLALWCAGIFHLHLLCDIIGARGPDGYQWPIYYFYPFCEAGISWPGQWAINAWPNFLITAVLIGDFLWQSARSGYSPLGLLSARMDAKLVTTLQKRFAATDEAKDDNA